MESAANNTAYYYRPIAYYNGKVLKCCGMVSEDNAQWYPEKCKKAEDGLMPGFVVTEKYMGDRIKADTHEEFTGTY